MDIADLRKLCEAGAVRWTVHVLQRLLKRGILQSDVLQAIQNGEIIEDYPDDYPYPSCLLLGTDSSGAALHVCCGRAPEELWMITAYYPDPGKWESDMKTRKVLQ